MFVLICVLIEERLLWLLLPRIDCALIYYLKLFGKRVRIQLPCFTINAWQYFFLILSCPPIANQFVSLYRLDLQIVKNCKHVPTVKRVMCTKPAIARNAIILLSIMSTLLRVLFYYSNGFIFGVLDVSHQVNCF